MVLYPLQPNSPSTILSSSLSDVAVVVQVTDAGVLPAAPNTVVVGDDVYCETIHYTGKAGNSLTGCTRGYDDSGIPDGGSSTYGAARAWAAGASVSRNITAKDINDIQDELETLFGGGSSATVADARVAILPTTAVDRQVPMWDTDDYVAADIYEPGVVPFYDSAGVYKEITLVEHGTRMPFEKSDGTDANIPVREVESSTLAALEARVAIIEEALDL